MLGEEDWREQVGTNGERARVFTGRDALARDGNGCRPERSAQQRTARHREAGEGR